jgi:cytochrome b
MTRLLVWDLPVRLFHLLLGLTFIGAFTIANVVDDESVLFSAHMLLGLLMAFMVVLRLIWGFVGTKHARFADFLHGPRAVVTYLRNALPAELSAMPVTIRDRASPSSSCCSSSSASPPPAS